MINTLAHIKKPLQMCPLARVFCLGKILNMLVSKIKQILTIEDYFQI